MIKHQFLMGVVDPDDDWNECAIKHTTTIVATRVFQANLSNARSRTNYSRTNQLERRSLGKSSLQISSAKDVSRLIPNARSKGNVLNENVKLERESPSGSAATHCYIWLIQTTDPHRTIVQNESSQEKNAKWGMLPSAIPSANCWREIQTNDFSELAWLTARHREGYPS